MHPPEGKVRVATPPLAFSGKERKDRAIASMQKDCGIDGALRSSPPSLPPAESPQHLTVKKSVKSAQVKPAMQSKHNTLKTPTSLNSKRAEYCFESTVSEEENSLSLTEFCGKLGEFCDKLGEFVFTHKL